MSHHLFRAEEASERTSLENQSPTAEATGSRLNSHIERKQLINIHEKLLLLQHRRSDSASSPVSSTCGSIQTNSCCAATLIRDLLTMLKTTHMWGWTLLPWQLTCRNTCWMKLRDRKTWNQLIMGCWLWMFHYKHHRASGKRWSQQLLIIDQLLSDTSHVFL